MACTPITIWQRDAKNCWRNRSLDFIKSTNQQPFSGPPIFFKKILVVLWVKVRVVMRFSSSALIHNKNNIINIFGTVEFQLTPLLAPELTDTLENIRYLF
jgi:hypothetical protein